MPLLLLSLIACKNLPVEAGQAIGPLTTIDDGFVSAFLLPTAEGAVLFDTGNDKKAKAVLEALDSRGLSADDVTDIFVTHGHGDHVKALSAFPNARVRALEAERALISEESADGSTLTEPLAGGDLVEVGGHTIEVFSVPGHTEGSAVFLVDRVLVMGDVAIGRKDGTIKGPPKFFSDDPEKNDASVRALAEALDARGEVVDWLAFSHSGPLEGLDPLLNF